MSDASPKSACDTMARFFPFLLATAETSKARSNWGLQRKETKLTLHHQPAVILLSILSWDDDEVFSFERSIDEPRDVRVRRVSVSSRRNISVVVPSCGVCIYNEKITGLILGREGRLTSSF